MLREGEEERRPSWAGSKGKRKTFDFFQTFLQIANHFEFESNLTLSDSSASNKITRAHINQS
jgi:hypothetical protein